MSTTGQTEIERIRYWQGQRLRGRDFRDQVAFGAQLRWWHDRALHNAFGVSYGFAVTPVSSVDSLIAVEIGCGVAYDCFGRELILQTKREIPLPATSEPPASRMTLIAHYKDGSQFPNKRQLSGDCATVIEAPAFFWKRSSAAGVADGVPIARISYESTAKLESLPADLKFPDGLANKIRYDAEAKLLIFRGAMTDAEQQELLKLSAESSFQQAIEDLFQKSQSVPLLDESFSAPRARALARPRIGSGMTVPGGTAWELWSQRVFSRARVLADMPLGVEVTIDTSAAGFTETPHYFAWLEAGPSDASPLEGSLWNRSYIEFFPAPLAHIDEDAAAAKQFRFRLWMPNIIAIIGNRVRLANRQFTTEFLNFAQSKKLYVCWLGIQCMEPAVCEEIEERQCQTVNED